MAVKKNAVTTSQVLACSNLYYVSLVNKVKPMNKILYVFLFVALVAFVSCTTDSEDGDDWDTAKVCPETGTNSYGMPNRGTFTDERDGNVYRYTTIGEQVWMAENLRYNSEFSECMDHFGDSCKSFGFYYALYKEINSQHVINDPIFEFICPKGWHVPSLDEWKTMIKKMGDKAALRLKGEKYWGNDRGAGTDECSFNALPAGALNYTGSMSSLLTEAFFSTTTENEDGNLNVVVLDVDFRYGYFYSRTSTRCIKD